MEGSRYNLIKQVEDGMIIYNTLSGAVIKLDKENENLYLDKKFEQIKYLKELRDFRIIVDNLDDEEKEIIQLKNDFKNNNGILAITILTTTLCNLRCVYCFESIRHITMDEKVIQQTIKFLREYLVSNNYRGLSITWFGGEPLFYKNIIKEVYTKIVDLVDSLDIELFNGIITNGTLLDEDTFSIIKNMRNLNFVQVTIDGCKETHDARRPLIGQSSFDLIINNVSRYIDCLPFQLRVNIDQTNLSDIENLIEYLSKIPGFKEKSCIHFAKVVGDNSVCYTNREFAYKYSECCQFLKKYGFINSVKNLVPQVVAVQCPSLTKHHLLLDANGDIYNCWQVVGEVKYRIGTVFNGFTQPECELVETEQEKCLHCKVYPICHTGCPLHYDELLENNCKYIPELLIKDIEEYIVSEK